jgi:hypothetical protein
MQRRRFLGLVASGVAVGAVSTDARAKAPVIVRCRVAGVKYQDCDPFKLRQGAPVTVRRERFGDQACYRVIDACGATIGYVPRTHLALLKHREIADAWLAKVNPHAVPWKQLELALALR